MTAPVDEYAADTGPDDFVTADEPPETDPIEGEPAPFGWTRDRDSGELRPRKKPGRPKAQLTPEDMPPDTEPVSRAADRAPGAARSGRGRTAPDAAPAMPRGGIIAAGVNKLYRRAGKILRAMDEDLGTALIECTRKDPDEPDELTVGEAWENLCKTNPRIRAFAMRAISGGAWGDLVMAHAPIGIALFMKPWMQRLLPFERLVESVAEADDDTPEGEGGLPGGMTAADFGQMRDLAEQQARKMASKLGVEVSDAELAEASAAATARFGAEGIPPGLRAQPRRQSRARRRG